MTVLSSVGTNHFNRAIILQSKTRRYVAPNYDLERRQNTSTRRFAAVCEATRIINAITNERMGVPQHQAHPFDGKRYT